MNIKVNSSDPQAGSLAKEYKKMIEEDNNYLRCLIWIDRHKKLNFFEKKHYTEVAKKLYDNTTYFEDNSDLIEFWTCNINY